MGLSYGIGNLGGKVLGPAGLMLIMGASDLIKPAARNLPMLGVLFLSVVRLVLLRVDPGATIGEGHRHRRPGPKISGAANLRAADRVGSFG